MDSGLGKPGFLVTKDYFKQKKMKMSNNIRSQNQIKQHSLNILLSQILLIKLEVIICFNYNNHLVRYRYSVLQNEETEAKVG
jgi:hypothetical protein